MTSSTQRRIVITGASQGIGRATALALAARGDHVVLVARGRAGLQEVATTIEAEGGHAEPVCIDVTSDDAVREGVAQILGGGPVDVLVNNAGTCYQRTFLAESEVEIRHEFELNYFGALRMTRALLPSFQARGRGTIVNVSSLLGSVGMPTTANYGASKAALECFTQALRGEVASAGVSACVFVAPHTQTELGHRVHVDGVVSLPAAYVAEALVRTIDLRPRRHAASPVYRMFLRMARWFPSFMEGRLRASAKSALAGARPQPALDPGT